jgi:integrase
LAQQKNQQALPSPDFPCLSDNLDGLLAAPKTGRLEYADTRSSGLALRTTAAGVKSWSFRFRDPVSGKPARFSIGQYPEVSLAGARERADELRRAVAKGENPIERKRHERSQAPRKTFQYLAGRYMTEHARRFKRSANEDDRRLKLHILPKWGRRNYEKISRGDVIELIEELIAAGTPSLANSVHALVSSMFTFALDNGLVHGSPCARLKKRAAENIGRRVLKDAEIRLFWPKVLHAPVSRRVGLALRLALLTGARAGEIAGLRRAELAHLDKPGAAEWVIPVERSKNGRAHLIPLPPLAVDTIRAAIDLITDDDEFVFPSPSAEGPITGHALAVAMKRFALKLVGDATAVKSWQTEPPTPHDLRRTFATRLSALGIPKEDRDACMNHARSDVGSRHYDLYERGAEKLRALTLWDQTLRALLSNQESAVIPLKKAAG